MQKSHSSHHRFTKRLFASYGTWDPLDNCTQEHDAEVCRNNTVFFQRANFSNKLSGLSYNARYPDDSNCGGYQVIATYSCFDKTDDIPKGRQITKSISSGGKK